MIQKLWALRVWLAVRLLGTRKSGLVVADVNALIVLDKELNAAMSKDAGRNLIRRNVAAARRALRRAVGQ